MEDNDLLDGDNRSGNSSKKRRYFKYIIWALVALFVLFMIFWSVRNFGGQHTNTQVDRNVEQAKKEWNDYLEEKYNKIKDDTYGGETPYETLEMYIDAVESEDYELASKYFTIENREEELESLNTAPQKNVDMSVELLKDSLEEKGSYNLEKTSFVIRKPLLVEFVKYPSNVWKIREI